MCTAFKEHEEVPKTLPLDFTEDDVTWVVSKLCVFAGTPGEEEIEIRNWLISFGCASEELRVNSAKLDNWMATTPIVH